MHLLDLIREPKQKERIILYSPKVMLFPITKQSNKRDKVRCQTELDY